MRSFLLRKTLSKSQKVMSGNHVEAGKSLTYLLCTKLYLLKDWRRGKISQKHDRISQENWKRGLYIPNKNKFPKNEQCNACNMADLWPFVWAVWSIYSVLYFLSGEMGLGSYGLYTEGVMMGLFNINRANIWDGPLRGFKRPSYDPSHEILVQFNSIQFYLYSAKLQQLSSQGT